METNKGLSALINATLHAVKVIIAGIIAGLLARKNDFKAVGFKFTFTCCHDLPGKVSLAFAISLRTGIHSAMAGIKRNNPHIARGALSISGNAIRRIGAFQCLLNRLSLNGIAIAVRIVNRSALGAHGAINNRKRIIPVGKIHLVLRAIALQSIGYRCEEICIRFQLRTKYKSGRIISRCRRFNSSLNPIGTYIVKSCGGKAIAVIGGSKGNDLISPVWKTRVGKIYILERGIDRFNLLMVLRYVNAKILISRFVNVRCRR